MVPAPGDAAPALPGAYALALWLEAPLAVAYAGRDAVLAPGAWVYAGSARGPGGLRARISRHFRATKPVHWHIDGVTLAAPPCAAVALPGGDECAIVARLLALPGFSAPLAHFGSSDCRTCPAHLLRWQGGLERNS